MPVVIRRVRTDEWQALRDLRLRALAGAPEMFGTTFAEAERRTEDDWRTAARRGATDEAWATVVADDDGALVGMATAARGDDGATELLQMWVDPRARRRGTGARLCEAVIARAEEWGSPVVRLAVNGDGPAAIDLYCKVGFVDTGRRESDLFHGRESLATIMERPLR